MKLLDTGWFKSSFSGGANETCVEVRITDVTVGVRDSKNASGPAFSFEPANWRAFLTALTSPR